MNCQKGMIFFSIARLRYSIFCSTFAMETVYRHEERHSYSNNSVAHTQRVVQP